MIWHTFTQTDKSLWSDMDISVVIEPDQIAEYVIFDLVFDHIINWSQCLFKLKLH